MTGTPKSQRRTLLKAAGALTGLGVLGRLTTAQDTTDSGTYTTNRVETSNASSTTNQTNQSGGNGGQENQRNIILGARVGHWLGLAPKAIEGGRNPTLGFLPTRAVQSHLDKPRRRGTRVPDNRPEKRRERTGTLPNWVVVDAGGNPVVYLQADRPNSTVPLSVSPREHERKHRQVGAVRWWRNVHRNLGWNGNDARDEQYRNFGWNVQHPDDAGDLQHRNLGWNYNDAERRNVQDDTTGTYDTRTTDTTNR